MNIRENRNIAIISNLRNLRNSHPLIGSNLVWFSIWNLSYRHPPPLHSNHFYILQEPQWAPSIRNHGNRATHKNSWSLLQCCYCLRQWERERTILVTFAGTLVINPRLEICMAGFCPLQSLLRKQWQSPERKIKTGLNCGHVGLSKPILSATMIMYSVFNQCL